jgi:hypothetical protein
MWTIVLTWLMKFVSGPVLQDALDAWKAKLAQETDHDKMAADLAARELVVQQAEEQVQTQYRIAEIGHWYEPDKIMGYTAAFLYAKVVVWDICLGLGTTNLHQGFVTITTSLIVSFYFGKRSIENVAKIWKK